MHLLLLFPFRDEDLTLHSLRDLGGNLGRSVALRVNSYSPFNTLFKSPFLKEVFLDLLP